MIGEFRNKLGADVFHKYQLYKGETWENRANTTATAVTAKLVPIAIREAIARAINGFVFMPGGRYLYYAGRKAAFWNNCFLLRAEEDTREEWARLARDLTLCLMVGGGVGVDYSVLRQRGQRLSKTGGVSSGAVSCAKMMDGIGHEVRQGGGRRSALYASLNWQHGDVPEFLGAKNWHLMDIKGAGDLPFYISDAVEHDFDFRAPLSHTNMSLNYDDVWLNDPDRAQHPTWLENVHQACMAGEPGFSFNFGEKGRSTLRNACTEVDSEDDSDVCNLGSVNMARCETIEYFSEACYLAAQFQICGSLRSDVPYAKVKEVRDKNRRIGVGLMGLHEWLLRRGYRYEVTPELREWLGVYRNATEAGANDLCDDLGINRPIAYQAIAPTGTIGLLAGTTQGIEPIFAVAYQRRWRQNDEIHSSYVVDASAHQLIQEGVDPDAIETAIDLAKDIPRRLQFQADVQEYVDQGISSTVNLPPWGSFHNNEERVTEVAETISKYAPRLRGLTFYPDASRGGQPIVPIDYHDIKDRVNREGMIEDNTDKACRSGVCGI